MTPNKLPYQAWQEGEDAQKLMSALKVAEGATRLVGGAVRDALLGLPVTDIDLATQFSPEIVMERLTKVGLKVIPTGIEHGTVTALADGHSFEITTLRRDIETDGRRARVDFTTDWQEDAARRDFTINALSANPVTGEVFDYFGGLDDLKSGRVRFIGDPLLRIAEDHLRILRFFRFCARFGQGALDEHSFQACITRAKDLMALSRERIRDELLKLLGAPRAAEMVEHMVEHGIFTPIIPEIGIERVADLKHLISIEREVEAITSLRRLAVLLPTDQALLEDIARRLRLSNQERKRLAAMALRLMPPPHDVFSVRVQVYRLGAQTVSDWLILTAREAQTIMPLLAEIATWHPPRLMVTGRDLMARGVPEGPPIAQVLARIEQAWIAEGFTSDPERIKALVEQTVREWRAEGAQARLS